MDKKHKIKKVIQTIWNIVSIIFVAFVSGALIINAISNADEKTQDIVTPNIQEEYKYKHNYGYVDEYGIQANINDADLSSNYFLINFVYGIASKLDNRVLPSNTSNLTFSWSVSSSLYSLSYGTGSYTLISNINTYVFNKVFYYTNSEDSNILDYVLEFKNNDTTYVTYRYHVMYPQLSSNNGMDIGFNVVYTSSAYAQGISNNSICIYENNNDAYCPLIEYFVKAIIDNQSDTTASAYSRGYGVGYNKGYSIGSKAGYDEGYDVGLVQGANGIESNAFTVIGQAFGAVANILNIQVLPSLPLWVLLCAPLIIAIVIVVVKMIKG